MNVSHGLAVPSTSEKGMPGSPFFNDIRNNIQP